MTQMSDEKFNMLIETIKALATQQEEQVEPQSKGSFSNCLTLFGGQRDYDALEIFITAVETYKETEGISDRDALKGLPLLFTDMAVMWWKGVRREAKTWQDAIQLLRDHFSPTKPAYQIYMEIFENKQVYNEPIDSFVCNQRARLEKLPEGRHDVETELDFVYGLLQPKFKDQIPRHDIKSFTKLLERCRKLERTKH